MQLPGRRRRGRPKRRYMDAVKEDMQVVRVEDTKNRLKWKTVIRCGNPWKGKSRKKKNSYQREHRQERWPPPLLPCCLRWHCCPPYRVSQPSATVLRTRRRAHAGNQVTPSTVKVQAALQGWILPLPWQEGAPAASPSLPLWGVWVAAQSGRIWRIDLRHAPTEGSQTTPPRAHKIFLMGHPPTPWRNAVLPVHVVTSLSA